MKHIPGPWTTLQHQFEITIVPKDRWGPCIALIKGTGGEYKANARLIAAAPEMLEALSELVEHTQAEPQGNMSGMNDQKKRLAWYCQLGPIRKRAEQAIAKAQSGADAPEEQTVTRAYVYRYYVTTSNGAGVHTRAIKTLSRAKRVLESIQIKYPDAEIERAREFVGGSRQYDMLRDGKWKHWTA